MGIIKKANHKELISLKLIIERRENIDSDAYIQTINYETSNMNATIATALSDINTKDYKDVEGNLVLPIMWQNACLQRKCGACAMVINGLPKLACNCFLKNYKKEITITPFRKFPLIKDLVVDRSVLFDNLCELEVWLEDEANITQKNREVVYEASRCLQCGCCLEVCPNFHIDDNFFGAAAFVANTGIVTQNQGKIPKNKSEKYQEHVYEGCGKSLACQRICPAQIDVEHLLIHSNKIELWKRKRGN